MARQYSGTLGKVANCQVGISVHAVTDVASCPLEWGLFVPPSWDGPSVEADLRAQTAARRVRCGIPGEERHRFCPCSGRVRARSALVSGRRSAGTGPVRERPWRSPRCRSRHRARPWGRTPNRC
uniref:transposase n=1 Tax=Nonomuraea antri TaxID=2730852 RepID=UPI0038B3556C